MVVHKIIDSEDAAQYLPFALSKLRYLAGIAPYSVHQKYDIDGVTITLVHDPANGQQYAKLSGGSSIRYEFLTSDGNSYPYTSPVYGYATNVSIGRTIVRPSMAAAWNGLNGAPTYGSEKYWVGKNSYAHPNLAFVQNYTTSKDSAGKLTVMYTMTPAKCSAMFAHVPDNLGTGNFDYSYAPGHYGWETPSIVYKDGAQLSSQVPLLSPPQWWRRGTVILAHDADGGVHPITVTTDAMCNFHFYRTVLDKQYTVPSLDPSSEIRYVPENSRVTVQASSFLPGWVAVPTTATMSCLTWSGLYDEGAELPTSPPNPYVANTSIPGGDSWHGGAIDDVVQRNDYLWSFNSDGTEASAIVHGNKGALRYSMLGPKSWFKFGGELCDIDFDADIKVGRWYHPNVFIGGETTAYWAGHGGFETVMARPRGLLSVSINVQVTGDGPTDFTVEITPIREIQDRWYIDVAYAMKHEALEAKGAMHDDLLTMELELFAGSKVFPGDLLTYGQDGYYPVVISDTNYGAVKMQGAYIDVVIPNRPTSDCPNGGASSFNFVPVVTVRNTTSVPDSDPILRFGVSRDLDGNSDYYVGNFNVFGDTLSSIHSMQYDYPTHRYLRQLLACDLKSLSFATSEYKRNGDYGGRTQEGARLYVLGDFMSESGSPPPADYFDSPDLTEHPIKVPVFPTYTSTDGTPGGYLAYSTYSVIARVLGVWGGRGLLNMHPNGHYSAYVVGGYTYNIVLDEIAYSNNYAKAPAKFHKTTHKSMFNSAFKQSRTYSDYAWDSAFSEGGFAAGGMWV